MPFKHDRVIKIGARGSPLALAQAEIVKAVLEKALPQARFKVVKVKTSGDADRKTPLSRMKGVGVFVKELERRLLTGEIDLAAHSAKDLPSRLPPEFELGAVPQRETVEDALICRENHSLDTLPQAAVIATGSPRRRALLKWYRPDLKFTEIRGNVETRLKKLQQGKFHALMLARAGLRRVGREDVISQSMPPDKFLPAPGQGALAVEIRAGDRDIRPIAAAANHPPSRLALEAERSLLYRLGVGCSSAVGAWARFDNEAFKIDAVVLDLEGKNLVAAAAQTQIDKPDSPIAEAAAVTLGAELAEKLLRKGAEQLMPPG